jgi:hypothetical protein
LRGVLLLIWKSNIIFGGRNNDQSNQEGWRTPDYADKYEALLGEELFVGIQDQHIRGLPNIQLLRRETGQEIEFVTIMLFDSLDAVRKFTVED